MAPLNFAKILFIITAFFCSMTNTSFASDAIKIKNLSNTNKIFQDKQGFVWLGGQQGLIRFDGEKIINFSSESPNYPLPFNWIQDFAQDKDLLLLATEGYGLWSFNTKTGKSKPVFSDINNYSIYGISIFQGNYYFQTSNNLYQYQTKTGNTHLIASNMIITGIAHTKNKLYISSESGLYLLQDKLLTKIIDQPISAAITVNNTVIAITSNNIYAITDSGVQISIKIEENISQITKTYNQDNFFTVSNQGEINKYSVHDLSKQHHGYEKTKPTRVNALFHDSSGVLWLASSQGVTRLYENSIIDHPITFDIRTNANEIALLNNKIIIGTYGAGLQNLFSKVFDRQINDNFTSLGLKITNLAVVDNELFMATFDGVWRYNNNSKQVSKLQFLGNNKLVLKIKHKGNVLYIATNYNGLYAYDLTKQKIIWNIKQENGLSSKEVIDILPLANGRIWLATARGLDIYNSNTGEVEQIKVADGNKLVSVLFAEQKIFAASLGNGIFVFNQQGHLLSHIGQGISFTGLLLYKNEIWASARPGLYRLSTKNHKLSMLENTGEYSFVGSSVVHNDILYSSHYGGILQLDLNQKPVFNPNVLISKTTVSGKSYLLNKTIAVASSNDLITLDLASLDYRPGLAKKYQYRINNNFWQPISGSQLTLTGLASGDYNIEIMATNSLGQWSDIKAYTEIHVAYPWYWTAELRVSYAIIVLFITLMTAWLLYLRTKSMRHIYHLLKDDVRNYGKLMKTIQRNLQLTSSSLENNEFEQSRVLIEKSLLLLKETVNAKEPDNLAGNTLDVAIPFLANYIHNKYEVKLHYSLDNKVDALNYELKSDVYRVIFEALTSAIFKSKTVNFNLMLQEVKGKLWLTINSSNDSFSQLNSKVNFDLAIYTIRQITNKHHASLNTFDNDDGSSQLVISFPLMTLS